MAKDELLSLTELAIILGVSVYTINNWYSWKRKNPKHEYAKFLPDPQQKAPHSIRQWKKSDVPSLVKFQKIIPRGRNGVMGGVTQRFGKTKQQEG